MKSTLGLSATLASARTPRASQAMLASVSAAEHPQCLICSQKNPLGLKIRFRVQPDGSVITTFPCRDVFQSYPETLHGGVITTLLDAAMTNALFSIGIVAVTAELTVRFLAPVALNRSAVVRAALLKSTAHGLCYLVSEFEQDSQLKARGSAKFWAKDCV